VVTAVDYIFDAFQITDEEYRELDQKFGQLCHFVAWDLKRKNSKNNLTDELDDIAQDLRWSIARAGVYTKRQRYLEACMAVARELITDEFMLHVLTELEYLWENRTRHGANKQKYGEYQEKILDTIMAGFIPENRRPDKRARLDVDKKFATYCKAIVWNCSKNLGKKITRERRIRSGMVSLSEHSFLCEEKVF
jgi:hypothetical protein